MEIKAETETKTKSDWDATSLIGKKILFFGNNGKDILECMFKLADSIKGLYSHIFFIGNHPKDRMAFKDIVKQKYTTTESALWETCQHIEYLQSMENGKEKEKELELEKEKELELEKEKEKEIEKRKKILIIYSSPGCDFIFNEPFSNIMKNSSKYNLTIMIKSNLLNNRKESRELFDLWFTDDKFLATMPFDKEEKKQMIEKLENVIFREEKNFFLLTMAHCIYHWIG